MNWTMNDGVIIEYRPTSESTILDLSIRIVRRSSVYYLYIDFNDEVLDLGIQVKRLYLHGEGSTILVGVYDSIDRAKERAKNIKHILGY